MDGCYIGRLPEELILHILQYLDSLPPSELKIRHEPSLTLTESGDTPYKAVSCVSRSLRRLTLPLLFRHSRLRLDQSLKHTWAKCLICNSGGLSFRLQTGKTPPAAHGVDQYHVNVLNDVATRLEESKEQKDAIANFADASPIERQASQMRENFLDWSPRFYHGLKDFTDFLASRNLSSSVQSYVISTDKMLSKKLDRFPHLAATDRDIRYRCSVEFWTHLLSVANNLRRVTILAPPIDLACLTNCAIDTFGDWAFGDMDFHVLTVSLPLNTPLQPFVPPNADESVDYTTLDPLPHRYPGLAPHSILNLRPWHSIQINEGAFLKAYGTYEYFERGPPSLIYSIKDCLAPRPIYSAHAQRISTVPLQNLRSFTYTGIFPFANHLDFRELLPQLEELDLQLAPEPGSNILQEPARVGKAQMEDLWSELITVYQHVAALLGTFHITARNVPRLKKFVCRDSKIANLQEELDEVFVPLCLPVWAEYEVGVFSRLKGGIDEVEEYRNISWAD
ncbi:hypothetical protein KC331_g4427 [Hortaea werneckii]|uniref:F-box domain-containing protein n=1 Tax=Hortaea werneckii TaxID=91943 RepID=A0A3M7BZY9_HORWE|nr:hypothetical protein KC331_g4427 [Hortaea werneckii]KAI7718655.1 hypothetical protein KC353_g3614 [Hortaea werneckii]RMY45116.1 hypothetical protein D0865_10113 [Hortaea werneckii]